MPLPAGTLLYMAPELLRAVADEVRHRLTPASDMCVEPAPGSLFIASLPMISPPQLRLWSRALVPLLWAAARVGGC